MQQEPRTNLNPPTGQAVENRIWSVRTSPSVTSLRSNSTDKIDPAQLQAVRILNGIYTADEIQDVCYLTGIELASESVHRAPVLPHSERRTFDVVRLTLGLSLS
jgi:hypothetical protein